MALARKQAEYQENPKIDRELIEIYRNLNSITNAQISSDAAIAYSKLNLTNSIVNADISSSAAIAFSKLASLTSANILVGNGSNVATSVAMTGDITISNAGVTAIGSGVIVNDDINASAAIAISKTTLGTFTDWTTFSPNPTGGGAMTYTTINSNDARYCQIGKVVFFQIDIDATTGGVANPVISFSPPVTPTLGIYGGCQIVDGGNFSGSYVLNGAVIDVTRYDGANWGIGAGRGFRIQGLYRVS